MAPVQQEPAPSAKPTKNTSKSRKACTICHIRKVRCDFPETGLLCLKCRESGSPCIIRQFWPRPRRARTLVSNLKSLGTVGPGHGTPWWNQQRAIHVPLWNSNRRHIQPRRTFEEEKIERLLSLQIYQPSCQEESSDPLDFGLPNYIASSSRELPEEDTQYLRQKGACSVPDISLVRDILQAYIKFVHPSPPSSKWRTYLR